MTLYLFGITHIKQTKSYIKQQTKNKQMPFLLTELLQSAYTMSGWE